MRLPSLFLVATVLSFFEAPYSFSQSLRDTRFVNYDAISVNQEVTFDQFDLGEVYAGDQLKVQFYVRNRTKTALNVVPDKKSCSEIAFSSESISIEPGSGAIVHLSLSIPKNPKYLEHAFGMELMLTEGCRLICTLKAKVLGVVSFEKDEYRMEIGEDDTAKRSLSIPILLSDVDDVPKLIVVCSDSLSFLSVSAGLRDGKPVLLVSLLPEPLQRSQYHGQIWISKKDTPTRCSANLTIVRKGEYAILPETVVFKAKPDSHGLTGEAIFRCRSSDAKIDSLSVVCDPSAGGNMKCEIKKINDQSGRIYFTLERSASSITAKSGDVVLIEVYDGSKVRKIFVTTFIAD